MNSGADGTGSWIFCETPIDGACGTADNAVQGCTAGTWQDETGDGWTCLGTGGGADASCGISDCYHQCIYVTDGAGLYGYDYFGTCEDGTTYPVYSYIASLPACEMVMATNNCTTPVSTLLGSECCTGPGACPPAWYSP